MICFRLIFDNSEVPLMNYETKEKIIEIVAVVLAIGIFFLIWLVNPLMGNIIPTLSFVLAAIASWLATRWLALHCIKIPETKLRLFKITERNYSVALFFVFVAVIIDTILVLQSDYNLSVMLGTMPFNAIVSL